MWETVGQGSYKDGREGYMEMAWEVTCVAPLHPGQLSEKGYVGK